MRNKFVFSFSQAIDGPIYRILSILSVLVLTIWLVITLLHGHHYQVFDPNLGLLVPPVVCLFVILGFSERLEIDEEGRVYYYSKTLYVIREMKIVDKIALTKDNKYARIDLVVDNRRHQTGMIYKYQDALNVVRKCTATGVCEEVKSAA